MTARWTHNIHYHPVLLTALPTACGRVLDVGCGDGTLARRLRVAGAEVTAIDRDPPSIDRARHLDHHMPTTEAPPINYVCDDFLTHPFEADSYDAVVSVAALHHMDPAAALSRMRALLRPGGLLGIIGLARTRLPADLGWELAGTIGHRWNVMIKRPPNSPGEQTSPTVWPPAHTHCEMRRLSGELLPDRQYRRRLLWRYTPPLDQTPSLH